VFLTVIAAVSWWTERRLVRELWGQMAGAGRQAAGAVDQPRVISTS
jgi:hypothetical protein